MTTQLHLLTILCFKSAVVYYFMPSSVVEFGMLSFTLGGWFLGIGVESVCWVKLVETGLGRLVC